MKTRQETALLIEELNTTQRVAGITLISTRMILFHCFGPWGGEGGGGARPAREGGEEE